MPSPGTSILRHRAVIWRHIGAYCGVLPTKGVVCAARRFFSRVNLLWWRGPKLRHGGPCMSAPEGSGNLAAYCGVLRRIVVGHLCRRRCAEYLDARRRQVLTLALGRPKQRPRSSEARARVKRRAARCWAGRTAGVVACVQLDGMAAPERARDEPWRRRLLLRRVQDLVRV